MDPLRKMAEKAYHEWPKPLWENDMRDAHWESFREGYTRGRADAWQLPEVRAEELVVGEIYRYRGISSWFPVRVIAMFEECVRLEEFGVHVYADIPFKSSQNKFRGPLPLGGGE